MPPAKAAARVAQEKAAEQVGCAAMVEVYPQPHAMEQCTGGLFTGRERTLPAGIRAE